MANKKTGADLILKRMICFLGDEIFQHGPFGYLGILVGSD